MKPITRGKFAAAVDRFHAKERQRLLARFDVGQKRYGDLVLDGKRDWIKERQEELDDARSYEIFERLRFGDQ